MNQIKLMKQVVSREDKEYTNFYLCWTHEGQVHKVRVRSVFGKDFAKLYAISEEVPKGEIVEKYL